MNICPKCNLPKFFGVAGYAGPQCQCLFTTTAYPINTTESIEQRRISELEHALKNEQCASRLMSSAYDRMEAKYEAQIKDLTERNHRLEIIAKGLMCNDN